VLVRPASPSFRRKKRTTGGQISDVVKTFSDATRGRQVEALDHVSLSLNRNEFLCLLGPSGCGKSTLLNMIAGFEFPTSGSVQVGGVSSVPLPQPRPGRTATDPCPNVLCRP
jgi:ABC-type Fe3+/spermidine/putrescine transport system ATPase subunit